MPRRFPTPWSIDERDACFIMKDASGQAVAYVYCEDDAGRRTTAKLLTRDEARRIAANIIKLPDQLRGEQKLPANTAAVVKSISSGPLRAQYQAASMRRSAICLGRSPM